MNKTRKNLLFVAILFGLATSLVNCDCSSSNGNGNEVVATFVPRAQGRNKYVEDVGVTRYTHEYGMCSNGWGELSIIPEYTRTWRSKNISSCLFGGFLTNNGSSSVTTNCNDDCSTQTLLIQGSGVTNRSANALIAENFYLPPDFSSRVEFSPRITNAMVNFDLYIGLDALCSGLYARFYGPFVHTKWNLGFCENVIAAGVASLPGGLIAETDIPRSGLLANFEAYAQGTAPVSTFGNGLFNGAAVGAPAFGFPAPSASLGLSTTMDGLRYARMLQEGKSANGFADLYAELGWDFWMCDDYHLGVNLELAFPTGQKGGSTLLFSPRIGDDKWQLGGGVTGHYNFWCSDCDDFSVGIYLDANITHVFNRTEGRVFDLKGAPLSRYLLAERLSTNSENLVGAPTPPGTTPNPSVVFAYEVSPVANLTHRDVKIGYGVQADVVAWFNVEYCNFSWDIGYDFWARSREHIGQRDEGCSNSSSNGFQFNTTDNQWALKGDAQVFGYFPGSNADSAILPSFNSVAYPLSATQSLAQITCPITNSTATLVNTGIDSPAVASINPFGAIPTIRPLASSPLVPPALPIAINTSLAPVLLTENSIDYSVRTRGISHTIFTNLSYNFDCGCWMPFLGVGGFAEFGNHSNNDCSATVTCPTGSTTSSSANSGCDTTSVRCAVSQWGIWVKGGVAFN